MFHLVTKIISWKTKAQDSFCVHNQEKISPDEWRIYEKHLLDISKTEYVEDVKTKLKQIYSVIEKNRGFE